jgi:putative CRISPR-associated protein (TIGR02620 family)
MSNEAEQVQVRRRFAVTRHAGAAEWMQGRSPDAKIVAHIDPDDIRRGDIVMGTLPVNLARRSSPAARSS